MTTPVMTDDIVQGCTKFLLGCPELVAVVTSYPAGSPWIFQDQGYSRLEGKSGVTAVVISLAGGWSTPNSYNTLRLPRLSMEIFCDPLRGSDFNVTLPEEARRRLMVVYDLFDKRLHRVHGDVECWGTLRTINSTRIGEISLSKVPDGDGLLRGQVFYAVGVA